MMNDSLMRNMPPMLNMGRLKDCMTIKPIYDDSIRNENQVTRLMALSDIYTIYIPAQMSFEIYSKLYLALVRSLQKKTLQIAVKQRYENYKAIKQQEYRGIMGGADSFTIIGDSGIGKSSAINRVTNLICVNEIIEVEETKIIPILNVQCPWDSSVKGLLLEIMRKVDEKLGTQYYLSAVKARTATIDTFIGAVSTIALNNIGVLIVDEIQNVVNSKNGKNLIGMLTQLINNSGISICMVGTPECIPFFEQAMQLARRSLGLQYNKMPYGECFEEFCKTIFEYQYVKNKTEITPAIIEWLYEHSAGVVSVVVSLIHDAQEITILNGKEILNIETLNEAYKERLSLLHSYIQPTVSVGKIKHKKKKTAAVMNNQSVQAKDDLTIKEMVEKSKAENIDIVDILKSNIAITEVSI